jgi:hypothetical protein
MTAAMSTSIDVVVGMTALAEIDVGRSPATVLLMRDCLKVVRIYAGGVATQMVYVHVIGHRASIGDV